MSVSQNLWGAMHEFQNGVKLCVYVHTKFSGEGVYSYQNLFIYRAAKNYPFSDCFGCVKDWINFLYFFLLTLLFCSFYNRKNKIHFFSCAINMTSTVCTKMAVSDLGFGDLKLGYRRGHSLYPKGTRQTVAAFVTCPFSDLPVHLHINLLPVRAGVTWAWCVQDHIIRALCYPGTWRFW